MTSPHYSTPYSALTYPTYTPLSVAPVKSGGSSMWSDLSLLRAAVKQDLDHHHVRIEGAAQLPHTLSATPSYGGRCAAPDYRTPSGAPPNGSLSAAPSFTRANAPLYAPPGALPTPPRLHSGVPRAGVVNKHHFNNAIEVQGLPGAPFPNRAPLRSQDTPPAVGASEVGIQSDAGPVSRVSPNLSAFRQECRSLLALLSLSPPPCRAAPLPSTPASDSDAQLSAVRGTDPASDIAAVARQMEDPATTLSVHRPSVKIIPPHVPGVKHTKSNNVGPVHSTTYVQLMREMNGLASLVEEEHQMRHQRSSAIWAQSDVEATPTHGISAPNVTPVGAVPSTSPRTPPKGTPEKQCRVSANTRRRSRSRCRSPSRLVAQETTERAHTCGSFWGAQLLKSLVYLVERRRSALERIQAFEDTRAPSRRGASGGAVAGASGATLPPSPIRVADALLEVLRSVGSSTSGVDSLTAAQQRQVCTRTANLVAELTSMEELVLADLLNDAAAGATMEQESSAKGAITTTTAPLPPANGVSEAYRKDMMVTISLLERVSQENSVLRQQVAELQGQTARSNSNINRDISAKAELEQCFDHLTAENSRLASELMEMKTKLLTAEAVVKSASQEEVLHDQIDQQTRQLRDLRAELDDTRNENSALQDTITQLREALKRHRAVVHLLTRGRRGQSNGAATATERRSSEGEAVTSASESDLRERVKDTLCGTCDLPSSLSSSLLFEKQFASNDHTPEK